jgi:hypothetical protein
MLKFVVRAILQHQLRKPQRALSQSKHGAESWPDHSRNTKKSAAHERF